jgi:hypothetical protein
VIETSAGPPFGGWLQNSRSLGVSLPVTELPVTELPTELPKVKSTRIPVRFSICDKIKKRTRVAENGLASPLHRGCVVHVGFG